jgi:tRNA nucleotidyltransferase (CCA-adding enzyme)
VINYLVRWILKAISEAGGRPLIVGSYVREKVINNQRAVPEVFDPKDIDIEVFQMPVRQLIDILGTFGEVDCSREALGIFQFRGSPQWQFSIPCSKKMVSKGHKDFIVDLNPDMQLADAASHRDFTINSMAMDPFSGEIHDPFGGANDLKNHILRRTSEFFSEDPLRVLRGFQLCARFNLKADDATLNACEQLISDYYTLPKELIWAEWYKWSQSLHPEMGLDFLARCCWLPIYPEIFGMVNLPLHSDIKRIGDVYCHTRFIVEAIALYNSYVPNMSPDNRAVMVFAALCHDFGKVSTITNDETGIHFYGHDIAGEELTGNFLTSIGAPIDIIEQVIALVECHMQTIPLIDATDDDVADEMVRRIVRDVEPSNIWRLYHLILADESDRPPRRFDWSSGAKQMLEIASSMGIINDAPKPILMGRHLIEHVNMTPGIAMRIVLRRAYEAQLEGEFNTLDGAFEWLWN